MDRQGYGSGLYTQDELLERYGLAIGRIRELAINPGIAAPFDDYFGRMALFLLKMDGLYQWVKSGCMKKESLPGLKQWNEELYADILPQNYGESYANPDYAGKVLGEHFGQIFSFLYVELRAEIVYAYEQRLFDMTVTNELFLELYSMLSEGSSWQQIKEAVAAFFCDYSEITVMDRVGEQLDPKRDFAKRILMESDLFDLRYLYYYGEYIGSNEIRMADFLNSLSEEEIDSLAYPYVDGYCEGFAIAGIDLSKKETVNIRYPIGMERVVRSAVRQFADRGLSPVIYRGAVSCIHKRGGIRTGYQSLSPNRQYDYDHRFDEAIYFDRAFADKKLKNLNKAYEVYRKEASAFAGPACIETFGEPLFVPIHKETALKLGKKQQKLSVEYANEAGKIINSYIIPAERSFTIIAYPVPEIGDKFEEIFRKVLEINTLDKALYRKIQQKLIDALDKACKVRITGRGGNRTDLCVALSPLKNPERETLFENCLADVNIPVGEVFTSPKLTGTNGVLHVSDVYLNGLSYKDLELSFEDGMVTSYACGNFPDEEENRAYIKENVLFHHDTLPLGEFAIGTNTAAYRMAQDYKIGDKLPILIAEKMGPHFAVGDTCYSHAEEHKVYNPDGKEMIARDNECSMLRCKGEGEAYFNCHTDITIPYDELGDITAVKEDGSTIAIIEDGRFVLPGTKELNGSL